MLNQVEQVRSGNVDVIGCAGMLFLVVLALAAGRAFFSGPEEPATAASIVAQAEDEERSSATLPTSPTLSTSQVTETATAAALSTLTPSATLDPLVTIRATATHLPTITPLPAHTATAERTNTPPPTPIPMPTEAIVPPPRSGAGVSGVASVVAGATPEATEVVAPGQETAAGLPALLPTPLGEPVAVHVPILMYHYISIPPAGADRYRINLSIEPDVFRQQMAYLHDNGYTPVDFYDLSLAMTNQAALPAKPVIITLDDGYRDNYDNAYPILREFGFKATFFIVTEFVDRGNERYMTWAMIEEMARAGMRMEVHSRTHLDLRARTREELVWQILGPQQTLAAHIGYTPRYFSYPSGRYDEATVAMVEELGFWGAVTTARGTVHGYDGRFLWSRERVANGIRLNEFAKLLR